ncbi:MAG: mechanosensitive ion channel family protein [Nitrospinae bacterium]|nr:mechanosensitive ion channel family protein [Nitrospinota bacterium]
MSLMNQWISKENIYLIEVLLVLVFAFVADLVQKNSFRRLAAKAEKTKNVWDDAILLSIPKPLSIIIWVSSVAFAAEIIQNATNAKIFEAFYPLRNAIIIAALARFIILVLRHIEKAYLSKGDTLDPTTVDAISKLASISVFIIAALMILQTMGFSISGVLAFGGIGGLAVGFAAKDLLSNFFGGFIIYMDRPFAVGDWIRSPDREIEGTVEKIGWRITRIRTFDKRPLYIPNSIFSQISVENPSRMSNRRIKETIGLRYDDASKIEPIIKQVKEMLQNHPDIDTNKTLIVNFNSFAPSSLDFFIYTFTKTTDWIEFHDVKQDVLLKIVNIVEENGAEFAFPTSTMHLANKEIFKPSGPYDS